jgi:hypothetical protein
VSRRDPQGLGYNPTVLRTLLKAYRSCLPQLEVMRCESSDIEELLAIATVSDEIHATLLSLQRRLDRVETHRFANARAQVIHQECQAEKQASAQVAP